MWLMFLCVYYFIFFGTIIAEASLVREQYVRRNVKYFGKYQYESAVGTSSDVTIYKCTMKCMCNQRCLTFFYNSDGGRCILHERTFQYAEPSGLEIGWQFYDVIDRSGRCPQTFRYYRRLDFCYLASAPLLVTATAMTSVDDFAKMKNRCGMAGAELIKVTNQERQFFIQTIVAGATSGHIVIQGTRSIDVNRNWTFDDGSPMVYFNWNPNGPTSTDSNIVIDLGNHYKWRTIGQNIEQSTIYICEK